MNELFWFTVGATSGGAVVYAWHLIAMWRVVNDSRPETYLAQVMRYKEQWLPPLSS